MTLYVSTRAAPWDDVVVLSLSGTPAEEVLALLAEGVASITGEGQVVVIDVDALVLSKASVIRGFLADLLDRSPVDHVAFVCERLTGRRILRRWGGDDLVIARTLSDAWAEVSRARTPAV
jgi:hypothetical protein